MGWFIRGSGSDPIRRASADEVSTGSQQTIKTNSCTRNIDFDLNHSKRLRSSRQHKAWGERSEPQESCGK
jgi:hypothetical protein